MCNFVLVLGRLAVNNQNLLPDHPQGCPAGILASYNCFIAGEYKCLYNCLKTCYLKRKLNVHFKFKIVKMLSSKLSYRFFTHKC